MNLVYSKNSVSMNLVKMIMIMNLLKMIQFKWSKLETLQLGPGQCKINTWFYVLVAKFLSLFMFMFICKICILGKYQKNYQKYLLHVIFFNFSCLGYHICLHLSKSTMFVYICHYLPFCSIHDVIVQLCNVVMSSLPFMYCCQVNVHFVS